MSPLTAWLAPVEAEAAALCHADAVFMVESSSEMEAESVPLRRASKTREIEDENRSLSISRSRSRAQDGGHARFLARIASGRGTPPSPLAPSLEQPR